MEYEKKIIRKLGYDADKSIVYQSFKFFLYPSFYLEKFNPNHKAYLFAMKKKSKSKGKKRNYEKIALLIRTAMPFFLFATFLHLLVYALAYPEQTARFVTMLVYMLIAIVPFIVLHELLHISVFKAYEIPFNVKLLKVKNIPLGIALYSNYFKGGFRRFNRNKKIQYTNIALAPYPVIFLLCALLLMSNNIFICSLAIAIFISHLINLPLEFVFTEEQYDSSN